MMVIDQALRDDSRPNARTLGDRLEVHPRTVRRDIEYMRDQLLAPIEFDARRNAYFYREPSYRLSFLRLTEGELLALFIAERVLQQYRGTPFGPDLARAFAKITAALDEPVTSTADCRRWCEAVSFRTTAPAVFEVDVLRTLIAAIVQCRRIVIDYWTASRDSQNRRKVDPYHLMSCDGQYYLIAYCHLRHAMRQFSSAPGFRWTSRWDIIASRPRRQHPCRTPRAPVSAAASPPSGRPPPSYACSVAKTWNSSHVLVTV
jgi:predicted DNA-binding transcriptional regulator YafY